MVDATPFALYSNGVRTESKAFRDFTGAHADCKQIALRRPRVSEYGHVKISRKAYAEDRFWNEPREFSRWEAWEWMIQAAAWKDHKRPVGMTVVELRRGEFLGSIRYLADAWGWTVKRVRVFLDLVCEMDRIRAQRETRHGTVYLLVNYDAYQSTPTDEGADQGTAGAQQGHSTGQRQGTVRGTDKGTANPSNGADHHSQGAQLGARNGNGKGHTDAEKRAQSRSSKETDTTTTSPTNRAGEKATDIHLARLRSYLGDHAHAVDLMLASADHPPTWAAAVLGKYGDRGTQPPKGIPRDRWPAVLGSALFNYAAEGGAYRNPYFDAFYNRAAKNERDGHTERRPDSGGAPAQGRVAAAGGGAAVTPIGGDPSRRSDWNYE